VAVNKPYNNGQWTQARFKGFIVSQLRSATTRWGPKQKVIQNARVSRGLYKCEGCGKVGPPTLPPEKGKSRRIKNIVADHKHPIVTSAGFVSYDEWIDRCFVELDGFQALCHKCHTEKSLGENAGRATTKTLKQENEREYNSWKSMRARCTHSHHHAYHRYGGRGIEICPEWEEFSEFLKDMGGRPLLHTLDRVDVNLGYSKGNCRWATHREQANNRSDNTLIEVGGVSKTLSQWSTDLGIPTSTICGRLSRGDSVEKALDKNRARRTKPPTLDYEEIYRGHLSGLSNEVIAANLGCHKDTVRKIIATKRRSKL